LARLHGTVSILLLVFSCGDNGLPRAGGSNQANILPNVQAAPRDSGAPRFEPLEVRTDDSDVRDRADQTRQRCRDASRQLDNGSGRDREIGATAARALRSRGLAHCKRIRADCSGEQLGRSPRMMTTERSGAEDRQPSSIPVDLASPGALLPIRTRASFLRRY
jgi:hypothetical protein